MFRSLARIWPLLLGVALLAAPASADVFYVTLTNGTVLETAHQPQQASWDPDMVLLLSEVGNWIGYPKDQVESIRSEDPTQGFGIRISDKAIALGRSLNDLPEEEKGKPQDELNQRLFSLAERQLQLMEGQRTYSVNQFVEPGQTQGVPSSLVGTSYGGGYNTGAGIMGLPGLTSGGMPDSSYSPSSTQTLNSAVDSGYYPQ
ncbi:MAG: hypothetical protein ACJ75H_24115 [Thermoanaerobaculia bacterium]